MNKEIEIIRIPLDGSVRIIPHPKQAELYGDEQLDQDFVESVRLQGILQRPVVTYLEDLADEMADYLDPSPDAPISVVIISGHRRFKAGELTELPYIDCEVRRYDNYFDSEVEHITFNKQRKKSKRQIAAELEAYKQKLSQVRKILENEGLEAVKKFNSFDFYKHVKVDENGRHFLPYGTELIEKELGITRRHQDQLNVIFSEDWEQDKIEKIGLSNLSPKKKKKATEDFLNLLNEARTEVDKKDGLSINKVYNEIVRVWNDIDSVINPKPKEPKKKKKAEIVKKWLKPQDFACVVNVDKLYKEQDRTVLTHDKEWIHLNDNGKDYLVNINMLIKYLKEQKL